MKRIYLSVMGLYLSFLGAWAQVQKSDSSRHWRKLSVSEVEFVSGYYQQTGNHSAVTGGIGTEALNDYSNELSLTFAYQSHNRHSFKLSMGVDHYTSASSDKIDESTFTSASTLSRASHNDTRYYPSVSYSISNPARQYNAGITASYSSEIDYTSRGLGVSIQKTSPDDNRSLQLSLHALFDRAMLIYPSELRPTGYGSGNKHDPLPLRYRSRNTLMASALYTQVINRRLQLAFTAEATLQKGYLATSFHRVYFYDLAVAKVETLPENRLKIPLAIRLHYFAGDRVVLRSNFRLYADSWGILAQTAGLECALKAAARTTISPYYRFHSQSAAKYYAPYMQHGSDAEFFTSDTDLSAIKSHQIGSACRFHTAGYLQGVSDIEFKYGFYLRSNKLHAHSFAVAFSY